MCLVLKNQNNNTAMGHIENGSAELQDKLEPLDQDLKIENVGPWLDEHGIILPVTSFSTLFKKKAGTFLSPSYFACLLSCSEAAGKGFCFNKFFMFFL